MTYDRQTLSAIYDVLIRCCEASGTKSEREDFVNISERYGEGRVLEYRFMGSLGFGGKVWLYNSEIPYVTCYQEDETPARRQAIKRANEELTQLVKNVMR